MYLCMLEYKVMLNFMALVQAQIVKEFQSREQAVLLVKWIWIIFFSDYFPCLFFSIYFPWLQISGMDYDWKNRRREFIAGSLTRDKETVESTVHLVMTKQMS